MPTRLNRIGTSSGLLLVATGLLVGVIALRHTPSASGADGISPLPPDIAALGVDVTRASPEGKISAGQAVDVAVAEFNDIAKATIAPYLVNFTNPTLLGGIEGRAIWVVKATGVSLPVYGTLLTPQDQDAVTAGTVLYVYIDALTGEWLLAQTE